jgi:hypothetical protein
MTPRTDTKTLESWGRQIANRCWRWLGISRSPEHREAIRNAREQTRLYREFEASMTRKGEGKR